ncbi:MAG: hypothetical protein SVM80_00110 [Halobacteriota archaeon]|nr:hypothetical protein [Halobacteriota archaeon]
MKSLLVYYSRTGTTKKVAEAISEKIDCDIEEIVDTKNRSGIFGFLTSGLEAIQKKEVPIEEIKKDPSEYDLVIIGSPTWMHNTPSPVRTYLSQVKGQIDNAAFFCTYGGTGYDKVFEEMQNISGKKPITSLNLRARDVKKEDNTEKVNEFVSGLSG